MRRVNILFKDPHENIYVFMINLEGKHAQME